LPGFHFDANTRKIAHANHAFEHNHVHGVVSEFHIEIRAHYSGHSGGSVDFKFAIRLGDFCRLAAKLAVRQLEVSLLRPGVVLDDMHGRF
jgi:hypothetical protein